MNAIVEVEAAQVSVKAESAVAITTAAPVLEVKTPVSTSPLRVVSISGHSISAVAPDHIFEGGLATAA